MADVLSQSRNEKMIILQISKWVVLSKYLWAWIFDYQNLSCSFSLWFDPFYYKAPFVNLKFFIKIMHNLSLWYK